MPTKEQLLRRVSQISHARGFRLVGPNATGRCNLTASFDKGHFYFVFNEKEGKSLDALNSFLTVLEFLGLTAADGLVAINKKIGRYNKAKPAIRAAATALVAKGVHRDAAMNTAMTAFTYIMWERNHGLPDRTVEVFEAVSQGRDVDQLFPAELYEGMNMAARPILQIEDGPPRWD